MLGYDQHDSNGNGADDPTALIIRRARLGVGGKIAEDVKYQVEADLAEATRPLRDAYLSLEVVPHHRIRIGQQKTPFGYENGVGASKLLVVRRAFVSTEIARGPTLRDLGIAVYGDWVLPLGLGIHYAGAVVNGDGQNVLTDLSPGKSLWGRAALSLTRPELDLSVTLGASGGRGNRFLTSPAAIDDDGGGLPAIPLGPPFDFTRWGGDLEVSWRYVALAAEYAAGVNKMALASVRTDGWYIFVAGHLPWNVGPVGRWQRYTPSRANPSFYIEQWMVGAYWDPIRDARGRLLVNYEIDRSSDRRDNRLLIMAQAVF